MSANGKNEKLLASKLFAALAVMDREDAAFDQQELAFFRQLSRRVWKDRQSSELVNSIIESIERRCREREHRGTSKSTEV